MSQVLPLLKIEDLQVDFATHQGEVSAIDGVSFELEEGEILGVVGESGCGKSVTAEAILQLLDEDSTFYNGKIMFNGENLLEYDKKKMEKLRGNDIAMIFQDPMSSLNPVMPIGKQIAESIRIHQNAPKKAAYQKAVELLKLTGIPSPEQRAKEYPHELSGGMRQRVMIAMALSCQPKLLIADEPTTALDVTIQAQILELITSFQKQLNMGIILITHDFGVIANMCTKVAVMYLGQVIEETDVQTLFKQPFHPYTIGLMKSVPQIEGERVDYLHSIAGTVPSLLQIPKGCRFAPRCKYATSRCESKMPLLETVAKNHRVRCWHYDEVKKGDTLYAD